MVAFSNPPLRPPIPPSCPYPALISLMQRCWDSSAESRPTFKTIVTELKAVQQQALDSKQAEKLHLEQEKAKEEESRQHHHKK